MACESCNEQTTIGTCEKFLNSDCIYVSEELTCTGVQADTILTTALKRMDEVICQIKEKVAGTLALVNIGGGAKVYKGLSNIGEKQLRTLISSDNSVNITEGADTIDFSFTVDFPEVPTAEVGVAGIAPIASQTTVNEGTDNTSIVTPLTLKNFVGANNNEYAINIVGNSLQLLENGSLIQTETLPTGENKFVNSFTINGTSLVLGFNDNTTLSKDISSLLNFTQVQSDYTQEDAQSPAYIKNRNASKTVFANYDVKASDNTYVIVVDSANPITISLPTGLPDKFTVGFIQKGTGLVTIANADIVPSGMTNTLKGKGHQAFVEKIEGTKFLFGNLNKAA
jgi:hypothetical protein